MSRRVRARRAKWKISAPENVTVGVYSEPAAEPEPVEELPDLEGMTVGELRDFARMRQIIITGRPRKAELVEAIRARLG